MSNQTEITVFEAFVSANNGKPFVQMTCSLGKTPVFSIKMSPAVATALGLRAIQAAIEAERDAGFIGFVRDGLQMDNRAAGMMLGGLREHRAQFDAAAGSMQPLSDDDPTSMSEE